MDLANRSNYKVFAIIVITALVITSILVLPGKTYAAPGDKVVTLQNERSDLPADVQIAVGQSKNFQVAYLNQALSSDPAIAKATYTAYTPANKNGYMSITGVKAGVVNLAYGNRNGILSILTFLITDSNNVSAYTLKDGGEMYFSIPASPSQRETRPSPVTVTAGQFNRITWSSMNNSVATVASNGAITSVGYGAAIITGRFIDKWGAPRDIQLLVGVGIQPGSVTSDPPKSEIQAGDFSQNEVLVTLEHSYSQINLYEGDHPRIYEIAIEDSLFKSVADDIGIAHIQDLTAMRINDSADHVVNPAIDTRNPESVKNYFETYNFHQILRITLLNSGKEYVFEAIRILEQLDGVLAAEPNYYGTIN